MNQNTKTLIKRIKKCNLSAEDKVELISFLSKNENDGFLKKLFRILQLADLFEEPLEAMLNDIDFHQLIE